MNDQDEDIYPEAAVAPGYLANRGARVFNRRVDMALKPHHPAGLPGSMRMSAHGRYGSDGFTLFEVLIAFAVLAMATFVIQRGVAASATGMVRAKAHLEADLVARTLMTGPLGAPGYGARRGRLGAYDWTLDLEPISSMAVPDTQTPFVPVHVTIRVTEAGRAQVLSLVETIRLTKAGEP